MQRDMFYALRITKDDPAELEDLEFAMRRIPDSALILGERREDTKPYFLVSYTPRPTNDRSSHLPENPILMHSLDGAVTGLKREGGIEIYSAAPDVIYFFTRNGSPVHLFPYSDAINARFAYERLKDMRGESGWFSEYRQQLEDYGAEESRVQKMSPLRRWGHRTFVM
ncbi:MAG: hypothetical protein ABH879_09385 [archaeon]